MRRAVGATIVALLIGGPLAGCSTSRGARGRGATSRLHLEVTPAQAHLYVDEEYQGRVDRWRDQRVPIQPGPRRIELRADGYITQRFDIRFEANEEVTLTLVMEPTLDRIEPSEAD